MSGYGSLRDQRVADEVSSGQDLMCSAKGCPHRWSVDAGAGRLCSFHAWSPAHQWPRITQERLDALAERAHRAQFAEQMPPPAAMSKAEKIQTLQGLRDVAVPKQGKRDWAFRVIERSKSGECVSPLVLKIAQAVARVTKTPEEASE